MSTDVPPLRAIRVKIVTKDWPNLQLMANGFLLHLRQHYGAQLVTSNPDIIICENRTVSETAKLKIFVTGENTHPSDESQYDIIFGVRNGEHPRLYPLPYWTYCVDWVCDTTENSITKLTAAYRIAHADIVQKTLFCGFVSRRTRARRVQFVKRLSEYRSVSCAGSVMNNTQRIADGYENKLNFLTLCKFTVAFENDTGADTDMRGYITEKIVEAFLAGTIPIYWGAPDIGEVFNKAAFLDRRDFASDEALIQRIAEIDKDDSVFKKMLREPVFVDDTIPDRLYPRNICEHIMSKLRTKQV